MCLLLGLSVPAQQPTPESVPKTAEKASLALPLSTESKEAREALQRGVVKWENHRMADALNDFRQSAKMDPNFAVAHLFVSTLTPSPDEQSSELKKAVGLRSSANPDEQLLIDWLANTSQNRILPAISSMNELLARYPNDKHLLYRAGIWFRNQRQLNHAVPVYERLLQLDPKFADALNQLGYIYAFQGEFDKALAMMKRYVAVLPNEPNPEDSYAEICRMAGRYDEAMAHYRRALKIDPSFVMSQEGIAGTYSLMGDQARARDEYAVAIEHAPSPATALTWTMNSAVTWIQEKNYARATAIFYDVAQKAHDNNLAELESTAYRSMSLYEKDRTVRLELLDRAEAVLAHNHPLSMLTREQQTALILRARIYAGLDVGSDARKGGEDLKAAGLVLEQLRAVAEKTHNGFIQVAFHGAFGALLAAQGKYEDAISELLEDDRNPYSVKFLIVVYQKKGATSEAQRWSSRLNSVKNPTLELALVMSSFDRIVAAAPVPDWEIKPEEH